MQEWISHLTCFLLKYIKTTVKILFKDTLHTGRRDRRGENSNKYEKLGSRWKTTYRPWVGSREIEEWARFIVENLQKTQEPTAPDTFGNRGTNRVTKMRMGWKAPQAQISSFLPPLIHGETAFTPSNQGLAFSLSEECKIEVCGLGTWMHRVKTKKIQWRYTQWVLGAETSSSPPPT